MENNFLTDAWKWQMTNKFLEKLGITFYFY